MTTSIHTITQISIIMRLGLSIELDYIKDNNLKSVLGPIYLLLYSFVEKLVFNNHYQINTIYAKLKSFFVYLGTDGSS